MFRPRIIYLLYVTHNTSVKLLTLETYVFVNQLIIISIKTKICTYNFNIKIKHENTYQQCGLKYQTEERKFIVYARKHTRELVAPTVVHKRHNE